MKCPGDTSSARGFSAEKQVLLPLPTKNALLYTDKGASFNDVCLRQMMLASPMMTASPDDVWLRHILRQTSHHCETKWSNIILSEAKNIISP
jgi:hypothetical protein